MELLVTMSDHCDSFHPLLQRVEHIGRRTDAFGKRTGINDGRPQLSGYSPTAESTVLGLANGETDSLLVLDGSCRRRTRAVQCHKEPLSRKLQ